METGPGAALFVVHHAVQGIVQVVTDDFSVRIVLTLEVAAAAARDVRGQQFDFLVIDTEFIDCFLPVSINTSISRITAVIISIVAVIISIIVIVIIVVVITAAIIDLNKPWASGRR